MRWSRYINSDALQPFQTRVPETPSVTCHLACFYFLSILVALLNQDFFVCGPGQIHLLRVPQGNPSPLQFLVLRWGSLPYHVSVSLAILSVVYLLVCRSRSVSPQSFCRRNCSVSRSRYSMFVGKVSSGSSHISVLDQDSILSFPCRNRSSYFWT